MLNRNNLLANPKANSSFVNIYFKIEANTLGGSFRFTCLFPVVDGYDNPTLLINEGFVQKNIDTYNHTFEEHPIISKEEFETDILRKLYNKNYRLFLTWSCNTSNVMIQNFTMQIQAFGEYSGGLVNPISDIIPFRVDPNKDTLFTCASDEYDDFMQKVGFTANKWNMYILLYIDIN